MLMNKLLTLVFVASTGLVASAQTEDAPTAPATPDRKVTTMACGGLRAAAFYVNLGGTICFDRHLNRYLVSFTGAGISSSPLLIQGFVLRVRDNGSVAGIYKGTNVGGYKAGGKLGIGAGLFVKSDDLSGRDFTGSALMFGYNRGALTDLGGFDLGGQAMTITPIH